MNIRQQLFEYQDLNYRQFNKKLIPTTDENLIIGVRMPIIRKIAKHAFKQGITEFNIKYYEEKLIYVFIIGMKQCSLNEHINDIQKFVNMIDNWGVCDSGSACFKFTNQYKEEMYDFIVSYIGKGEYQTRFAVVMLMNYYIDDNYIDDIISILKSIDSEFYYVNMAVAWAFSVIYTKYPEKITPLLKAKTLSKDVHKKTIQKICDSLRVDKETKEIIKSLK